MTQKAPLYDRSPGWLAHGQTGHPRHQGLQWEDELWRRWQTPLLLLQAALADSARLEVRTLHQWRPPAAVLGYGEMKMQPPPLPLHDLLVLLTLVVLRWIEKWPLPLPLGLLRTEASFWVR